MRQSSSLGEMGSHEPDLHMGTTFLLSEQYGEAFVNVGGGITIYTRVL